MAPPSIIPTDSNNNNARIPPLSCASTIPAAITHSTVPTHPAPIKRIDPSHFTPGDVSGATSPPQRLSAVFDASGNGSSNDLPIRRTRGRKDANRTRSRRPRRKRFKKLLWVKQSYPDNYTDQETFLENLQRNPSLKPYDFWPLVSDSTVILQHVCSVIVFVICFVGIFQERVSPVAVVGWGNFATFIGWVLWDWWVGQEAETGAFDHHHPGRHGPATGEVSRVRRGPPPIINRKDSTVSLSNTSNQAEITTTTTTTTAAASPSTSSNHIYSSGHHHDDTKLSPPTPADSQSDLLRPKSKGHYSTSTISLQSITSHTSATGPSTARSTTTLGPDTPPGLRYRPSSPLQGGRNHLRLSTIKSAILIYFTLLGLSPILKSLTRSTSSDSIWAMSFWLLLINVAFFDYSSVWQGAHHSPVASLSTNAALMASTVLASRLPSTGQVFSLTLFSIEVFGLFPVFRRYARHRSWRYHVALTVLLVLGAGAGVGCVLAGSRDDHRWPWRGGLVGMVVGCLMATLAMGGCSWWLIGLQKYKNDIYGPWDPARPIIISRRYWEYG